MQFLPTRHNTAMSENLLTTVLPAEWRSLAMQSAQLLARVQPAAGACVCTLLPDSAWHTALITALRHTGWQVAQLPADATQEGVARVIQTVKPAVVICPMEVFGWVSKLAFLAGCAAIYTDSPDGEGTLRDRARHFSETASGTVEGGMAAVPPQPHVRYDHQGAQLNP